MNFNCAYIVGDKHWYFVFDLIKKRLMFFINLEKPYIFLVCHHCHPRMKQFSFIGDIKIQKDIKNKKSRQIQMSSSEII